MKEKDGYYYFNEWTLKQIIRRGILAPLLLVLIIMIIYGSAVNILNGHVNAKKEVILILVLFFLILTFRALSSSNFGPAAAYFSHPRRDVLNMLKEEKFSRLLWENGKNNRFGDGKMFLSDCWFFSASEGLLIPKVMVTGISRNMGDPVIDDHADVFLFLIDGRSFPLMTVEKQYLSDLEVAFQRIFPNLQEEEALDEVLDHTSYKKELKAWFIKMVPDEKTFMDGIRNGIDTSMMPTVSGAYAEYRKHNPY